MGLQTAMKNLMTWDETRRYGKFIKKRALEQFLEVYNRMKLRPPDGLKYGDEMEYMLIEFDNVKRTARLLLTGNRLCEKLNSTRKHGKELVGNWTLEYSTFMIESTPATPFEGLAGLGDVERTMNARRQEGQARMGENEKLVTVSSFPRLGCDGALADSQNLPLNGSLMDSSFLPDFTVTPTRRFEAMTRNANLRRGRKISINVPVFQDRKTSRPVLENFNNHVDRAASRADHVYMDGMAFANGCCSLQITLQAKDLEELKLLYDQFGALSPIIKALGASSPIFRGFLLDIDTRWSVLVQGTDDRTPEEQDTLISSASRCPVYPRCSSIRSYISENGREYNDLPFPVDEAVQKTLIKEGVCQGLAAHLANTFAREPMLMFEEKVSEDVDHDCFYFESLQSLNYQAVRFKIPPPNIDMGWRLELRVCDVQLTDFENAAFVTFAVLLSRVIVQGKLNFLMPISKVDENMLQADANDAVRQGKFWCRVQSSKNNDVFERLSLNALINGWEGKFDGLIPTIRGFLSTATEMHESTRQIVDQQLTLMSKRASGDYLTTAQWIRQFVRSHQDYREDSVVTESICYDLMVMCEKTSKGEVCDSRILA